MTLLLESLKAWKTRSQTRPGASFNNRYRVWNPRLDMPT